MRKLLLALTLLCTVHCASAESLQYKLERADSLRTSDVAAFATLINELEASEGDFTGYQRDYFTYLRIFLLSLQGQFSEGIDAYQRLIDTTVHPSVKFRALYSIVNNFAVNRDFYNGSIYLEQVFALKPQISDQNLLDQSDLVTGLFYSASGQYSLGFEQAEVMLSRSLDPRTECLSRYMKVEAFVRDPSIAIDEDFMNEAIAFCSGNGEALYAAFVVSNKVRYLIDQGRTAQASQTLSRIEAAVKASNYSRILSQYYQLRAEIDWGLGDLDAAQQAAENAISHSETAKFNEPAINAYYVLHQVEKARGNFDQALEYFVQHSRTDKAFIDEVKLQNIAIQQAKHEYAVKQQQLVLANNQNQLLQAEAEIARASAQNQLVILLFMAALLTFGLIWLVRSHRMQSALKRLAETDGLTSLKNRRQFYLEANKIMTSRPARNKKACFIIFDLDFFKQINDKYGHAVGDWTLVKVASIVRQECRKQDIIGRLGGEEFGVFLTDCDQKHAEEIAEHLRRVIEQIDTTESGHNFQITASFGISEVTIGPKQCLDKLFTESDTALYQSKNAGRNRVYCYSEITV